MRVMQLCITGIFTENCHSPLALWCDSADLDSATGATPAPATLYALSKTALSHHNANGERPFPAENACNAKLHYMHYMCMSENMLISPDCGRFFVYGTKISAPSSNSFLF